LLRPLAAFVCAVAKKRLLKFNSTEIDKSSKHYKTIVIVVGNIVVGGSGKTPFIQWLVNQLKKHNFKIGIVSRGYGGKSKHYPILVTSKSNPSLVGDEPVLLAKHLQCPVAVAPKRPEAVTCLLEQQPLDIIISDDGLQHYPLERDIEIVMLDAQRLLGNERCIPAGPLRESKQRLKSVDFIVYNGGSDTDKFNMNLQPVQYRNVANPDLTKPLDGFKEQQIVAIAGIGNPSRFFSQMRLLAKLVTQHAFADHANYNFSTLNKLCKQKPLVMTEKDAVKCREFATENWWYLEIQPKCSNELFNQILTKIKATKK
jgi:tetraacyldisaccharide 4'-kinase